MAEYVDIMEASTIPVLPTEQRVQFRSVDEAFEAGWRQALEMVAMMEPADVKPVVRAKWEWNPDGMDWGIGAWICSACKSRSETWWATEQKLHPLRCSGSHYCGNCGAKMEALK